MPSVVTAANCIGAQPLFLPGSSLGVIYWNFVDFTNFLPAVTNSTTTELRWSLLQTARMEAKRQFSSFA
jgi:hypothetical protein